MKQLMRQAALSIPSISRLYKFALTQSAENAEHRQLIERLRAELETSKLQLYVAGSDQQRAAVRNESLSKKLHDLEDSLVIFKKNEQTWKNIADDLFSRFELLYADYNDRMLERLGNKLSTEQEALYSKLSGRLTMLASEISVANGAQEGPRKGAATLYLDIVEKALIGSLTKDPSIAPWANGYDKETRAIGRDWPATALTMIGAARLRNVRMLAERVLSEGVPGDMLEAGVWRGGACILLRAVLQAHCERDRTVWVADSFRGLPRAEPERFPADRGDAHSEMAQLRVSLEEVRENFDNYGLLDKQVKFLAGWFEDTLFTAPVDHLAILRLDGDMYSSTFHTLEALYGKVSSGGFIIIDDYLLKGCQAAVDEFRERNHIGAEIHDIDGAGVYWRKS